MFIKSVVLKNCGVNDKRNARAHNHRKLRIIASGTACTFLRCVDLTEQYINFRENIGDARA